MRRKRQTRDMDMVAKVLTTECLLITENGDDRSAIQLPESVRQALLCAVEILQRGKNVQVYPNE